MKVLVFSDTHLSDIFDEKKYQYLAKIIKQADKVIINGDFWEGHGTTFGKFITSPWKQLFPLLKKRHAVYLYGNHDKKEYSDDRAGIFSDIQTKRYKLLSGDKTFIFDHGDAYALIFNNLFEKYSGLNRKSITYLLSHLHEHIVSKKLTRLFFQRYNDQIKKRLSSIVAENEILVCGHTHCAEFNLKNRYINTGPNVFGIGHYIYIENGVVTVGEERYG